ncbi:MAG: hypothetical protein WCF74_06425, partial [Candidatus Sulfotelmatobacter sp.]
MRLSTSRPATPWISALCLLAAFLSFDSLVPAQQAAGSKRKLSQQWLLSQPIAVGATSAQRAKSNAPPPTTTDTWTGDGSNADWSNASNWNNGAITTGENIAISLTTAATTDDQNFTIGTLSLSNSGDSVTVNNNVALTVGGNISNAGTIKLDSTGNNTELVLNGNVTLSGAGTLTMGGTSSANYIFGSNSLDQLTNQSTIQGQGHLGNGQMALVNTGTINANASGGITIDVNDGFTNTGTVEATGGNTLILSNSGTINNTGGTITATGGSTVQVNSTTISGGKVTLTGASTLQLNSSTIQGGTITNSSTGTIQIASGFSNYLGGTINNSAGGILNVENNTGLNLYGGTYSQLGAIQLNSAGNTSELVLQGSVTLSGGSITMS